MKRQKKYDNKKFEKIEALILVSVKIYYET